MLILTRKVGQTVVIQDDITITVLGVKREQVRLGITAPLDIPVHREEVFKRIKAESLAVKSIIIPRARRRKTSTPQAS